MTASCASCSTSTPPRSCPVGGSYSHDSRHTRQRALTFTFVVQAVERLPITPANERRLEITPPAGTRTVVRTAADKRCFEREYREWRQRCRPRKGGGETCPGAPPDPNAG